MDNRSTIDERENMLYVLRTQLVHLLFEGVISANDVTALADRAIAEFHWKRPPDWKPKTPEERQREREAALQALMSHYPPELNAAIPPVIFTPGPLKRDD